MLSSVGMSGPNAHKSLETRPLALANALALNALGRAVQGYLADKKRTPLGPYSRTMPRDVWWS